MTFQVKGSTVVDINRNATLASANVIGDFAFETVTKGLQGTVSGYTTGGNTGLPTTATFVNTIDKFSFASDGNATDVGDLSESKGRVAGQSSSVSGYTTGGSIATPTSVNTIDRFPFVTDANATDVGDLSVALTYGGGLSSVIAGYVGGGGVLPGVTRVTTVSKFPFAADTLAVEVSVLTEARHSPQGTSSAFQGFFSSGDNAVPPTNTSVNIDTFPFATDANATDVGDLLTGKVGAGGQSSLISGYVSGGGTSPIASSLTIEKFPFAIASGTSTSVGDLTVSRRGVSGQSSTVSGYSTGGRTPPSFYNIIDKFPFATDANATDVGDLNLGTVRYDASGQQY